MGQSRSYIITFTSREKKKKNCTKSLIIKYQLLQPQFLGPLQITEQRDTLQWALDCCPAFSSHTTSVIIRLHLCFSQWSCLGNPLSLPLFVLQWHS